MPETVTSRETPAAPARQRPQEVPAGRKKRNQDIIDAAIKLFAAKGFAATSIQDIAAEVGLLKGSIYYYYRTKDSLLIDIFEQSHQEALEIIKTVERQGGSTLPRLRTWVTLYVEHFTSNITRSGLYNREWRYLKGPQWSSLLDKFDSHTDYVRGLLTAAVATGELSRRLDTKYMTFFIFGGIHSIADWYHPDGPETPQQIAQRWADLVMDLVTSVPGGGASRDAGAPA
jgi:AcrR family transcriptional regulator